MSLTPDGRVTIPVDLDECKVELLGDRHSATQEAWVLAMCEEIEQLRAAALHEHEGYETAIAYSYEADRLRDENAKLAEQIRELESKQFVGGK